MRHILLVTTLLIAACAHEELGSRPPSGVDLSGQWRLNVADSDDPLRLTQQALSSQTAGADAGGSTAPPQGGRGRGQRQGGAGGLGSLGGPMGPSAPGVMTLDEALRWPGKDLSITQGNTAITFSSAGRDETCRPGEHRPKHKPPKDNPESHDAPQRGRGDALPPHCGWDEATLVVQPRDTEEDHAPFDKAFTLSEDRQRLIEVVTFRGGRSGGFTASRVWDRAPPGGSPSAGAPPKGNPPSVPQ